MSGSNESVDPVLIERRARQCTKEGTLSDAVELWTTLLRHFPNWEHGYASYALAGCQEDLGQLDAAKASYELALSQSPTDMTILGGYSSFLYLHGYSQDAFNRHLDLLKLEHDHDKRSAIESTTQCLIVLGGRLGLTEGNVRARIRQVLQE